MTSNQPSRSPAEPRWLLVSDLDDTLTGDDAALARFVEAVAATPELRVAINSSRPLASVDRTLTAFPAGWRPAAVIGAMGSEIRVGGAWLPDWPKDVDDWDRERVDRALASLGLVPHEAELQGPYKVSYTVPLERQAEAVAAVEATGIRLQTVLSGGTNLDVLPASAGKQGALTRLVAHFGLDPSESLIVAGDSANDLAMFELAPRGIVVANAGDELRHAVAPATAYFASRDRAAGVIEGLQHWGVPITAPRQSPA